MNCPSGVTLPAETSRNMDMRYRSTMGDTADGRWWDGRVVQDPQTRPADRERRKDSTDKGSFTAQRRGGETEQVNQRTDATGLDETAGSIGPGFQPTRAARQLARKRGVVASSCYDFSHDRRRVMVREV